MGDEPITAVIVDDHTVVAAGVSMWCAQADPPIRLIDAEGDITRAWLGPGADAAVVIFDLQLSRNAAEIAEFGELRRLADAGRCVVVYSQYADVGTAITCIEIGALAYVTKLEGSKHLVAAIEAAAQGLPYTPPSLGGAIVADDSPTRPRLAPMEIKALRAWFNSSSKKMAARRLNISSKTLESYIYRVRTKYANVGRAAPTKAALVQRALEDGVLTLKELSDSTRTS